MIFRRSRDIPYRKPDLDFFLGEYNTLLASILVAHADELSYVASPVINRMEAQTHFYEKLEKYLQLRDQLARDADLGIIVTHEDDFLFGDLCREFGSRVIRERRQDETFLTRVNQRLKKVHALRFLARMAMVFFQTLLLILAAPRIRSLRREWRSVIRTYFDFRSDDGRGKLREEYFGAFAADLVKQERVLVVFKLLHLKDLKAFLKLRNRTGDFDSCLLESFLDPFVLVKALWRFGFSRIRLTQTYHYRGLDITGLLQKAIDSAFYSLRGIEVFLEYEAAQKILALDPERLYFPYENQTWEKVYPLVKNKLALKGTRIIGFQHTGLSYKLIMYFPALIEKDLPLYPDKIVTVGKIFQRLLREKAHFPCAIMEGAALRQEKHVVNGRFNVKPPHSQLQKKLVYAFSYDLSKYRCILEALVKTFQDSKVFVYLKMHPDYKEEDVLRSLGLSLPGNIRLSQKIPWDTIYRDVDCVLYDDNSIGVEGMLNGVKTFMLDVGEPIYDCGRMFYFDAWETSVSLEGLARLRDAIEAGTFDPGFNAEKVKEYLGAYYRPYTPEKCFAAYL